MKELKNYPMFGKKRMKLVKKYKNFILFEDEKTKVKECFLFQDLGIPIGIQNVEKKYHLKEIK